MKASVPFTLNDIRSAVMSAAGFFSITPAHCHLLAGLIKTKTGQSLSPTTLKRIFGFARSETRLSLFTLDVLAKFCGYAGWHHWQQENKPCFTQYPGCSLAEKQLDQLFYAGGHPMWLMDEQTLRFSEVNEPAVKVYGYPRTDLLSMRVLDIRPAQLHHVVVDALKNPAPLDFLSPVQHHCADGSVRQVQILSYRLPSGPDSPTRLIIPIPLSSDHFRVRSCAGMEWSHSSESPPKAGKWVFSH